MMKSKTWLLVSLAAVLLVLCVARTARSPAVSAGAQSGTPNAMYRFWEPSAAGHEDPAPSNGNERSAGANNLNAVSELHLRQLETAGAAQQMRQQEAAHELQRRQQQATRPRS